MEKNQCAGAPRRASQPYIAHRAMLHNPNPIATSPVLSHGFRPFFFAGAVYACGAMIVWTMAVEGDLRLTTNFAPLDWHSHEMLFGYLAAVLAGFLLTTIARWTGRPPVAGNILLLLVLLWLAGRLAIFFSAIVGWRMAAAIDLSFLVAVAAIAAREILSGGDRGNIRIVLIVGLMIAANAVFHLEAGIRGVAEYGPRLGLSIAIVLIMVMAGRIIPRYTRRWLAREKPGCQPADFNIFDAAAIAAGAAALVFWILTPQSHIAGMLLIGAGILHLLRLARWAGGRTLRNPLIFAMHAGYAFVPTGFLLSGIAALPAAWLPLSAGVHAWGGGAIGTMTLAVMMRTSLRHTGHALVAGPATQAILFAAAGSGVLRILATLPLSASHELLFAAGFLWIAAFSGFAAVYGPALFKRRII